MVDDEVEPETDEYVTSDDDGDKRKASKKSSKIKSNSSKKVKRAAFVFEFDDGETVSFNSLFPFINPFQAYSAKNERTESEEEDESSSGRDRTAVF